MALGGGSAIDTAKALARIIAPGNDVSLSEHLREGRPFGGSGTLPIVAIPTTAGTGAEVTPFGTIWDRRSSKKCSIDGMDLFPEYAILDPLLTMGLPEEMTISTGMDAISHAFESIWNRNAGPITISNATASLRLSLGNLPKLKNDPGDIQARRSMMDASTMAGLAISHTRTALAHSLSYPLTAELDVPHGLACGFALPQILMFNMVNDDGRLARLATDLGFTDVVDLAQGLQDIMDHIGVRQLFMRKVGNFENVIGRSTLMINKKRASNNLRTAEEGDIRALLMEWASSNQIA
jgi:alcohol dehydrogenase